MPLEPTFPTPAGIKKKSIGTILRDILELTWDPTKTDMTILKKEIHFDSSNQDFPASKVGTRPIVIRCHSQRTLHQDLEVGLATILYTARPAIHVFAYDVGATTEGKVSDLGEDVAQYIRNFIAMSNDLFQAEGLHSVVGLDDTWVSNSGGDPNWHHWIFQLECQYEMRRVVP